MRPSELILVVLSLYLMEYLCAISRIGQWIFEEKTIPF